MMKRDESYILIFPGSTRDIVFIRQGLMNLNHTKKDLNWILESFVAVRADKQ